MSLVFAWGVHLYTALGAPIALAAILAIFEGNARASFLWMLLALIIDATDGTLARAARVGDVVPKFDGARLDDIIDYLNYTLVPIIFAVHFNMLPEGLGLWVAGLTLVASAYGFCQAEAKTGDFFFTGFPSYWNVAVYYLFALELSPNVSALVLLLLAGLVFVPIRYIYPSRNRFLRGPTITLGAVWAVIVVISILQLPQPSQLLLWMSLAYPAWYLALSLYLNFCPTKNL